MKKSLITIIQDKVNHDYYIIKVYYVYYYFYASEYAY